MKEPRMQIKIHDGKTPGAEDRFTAHVYLREDVQSASAQGMARRLGCAYVSYHRPGMSHRANRHQCVGLR
jgi:hypothetical protein